MTPLPPLEAWPGLRVVVVVAHPDDEVLGCGATLAQLRDVRVVHVTDGAPRDGVDAARHGFADPAAYAGCRRDEAAQALALAGVPGSRLMGLGVPDQGAANVLADLPARLRPFFADADLVLTHTYEGGHPDHDAVAFATRAACDGLRHAAPTLVEMPFYHGDETGWVRQRFLPHPSAGPSLERALSHAERDLKARMAAAHASQRDVLEGFALDRELFRSAPAYDFTRRPHGGPLLYERHGWGLTWAGWVTRVEAARAGFAAA